MWMAVWAAALFAAPFLIEAGIVFLPWVVRGGGMLTTRVHLGGSEAGAHLAAGVRHVRRGQHAGGSGGGADRVAAGYWRLAYTIQLPPLVAAERERRPRPTGQGGDRAADGGPWPPRGDAASRAKERQIPQRDGAGPRHRQVGQSQHRRAEGGPRRRHGGIDETYVTRKVNGATSEAAALKHNEQLGIGALDALKVDPKRVREIWIYTERAPCLHCTRAIQDLEARYPNARIRVADTYGKVSWREHHEEGLSGPMFGVAHALAFGHSLRHHAGVAVLGQHPVRILASLFVNSARASSHCGRPGPSAGSSRFGFAVVKQRGGLIEQRAREPTETGAGRRGEFPAGARAGGPCVHIPRWPRVQGPVAQMTRSASSGHAGTRRADGWGEGRHDGERSPTHAKRSEALTGFRHAPPPRRESVRAATRTSPCRPDSPRGAARQTPSDTTASIARPPAMIVAMRWPRGGRILNSPGDRRTQRAR